MRDFERDPNDLFGDGGTNPPNEEPQNTEAETEDSATVGSGEEQTDGSPLREERTEEHGSYEYPPRPSGDFRPGNGNSGKRRGGTSTLLIAFCLVLFIFVGISIGAIFDLGDASGDPGQSTTSATNDGTGGGSSSSSSSPSDGGTKQTAPGATVITPDSDQYISVFREIANECLKTVAEIYVQTPTGGGAGSGVIYDPNGYIVTNYHVANDTCTSINVILYDGTEYKAQYIYGDELADLAVIKIDKTNCDYAAFGDSDHLTYGDMVLAIGNPQGLGLSVTDGIISRPGEAVTIGNATMTLLRTSAAVNSGNSGGGLFNLNGELIGIVNAKLAATTVDNIGYAIPSNTVVKSLNDLKNHGYITGRARLGITVETKQYNSWPFQYTLLQVKEISASGSAASSELKVGDILYQYQGVDITSYEILSQQLTKYSVGDTVKLSVLRPTIELTSNNIQQYLKTAEVVEIEITFTEFNPNA